VRGEALGVGPSFDAEERRADLDPEKLGAHRAAFLETVSVLADLAAAGHFPLDRESPYCPFCPYVRACRRTHPATVERLAMAPEGRAYALLRRKTTKAPTLADAEARNTGAEEEA